MYIPPYTFVLPCTSSTPYICTPLVKPTNLYGHHDKYLQGFLLVGARWGNLTPQNKYAIQLIIIFLLSILFWCRPKKSKEVPLVYTVFFLSNSKYWLRYLVLNMDVLFMQVAGGNTFEKGRPQIKSLISWSLRRQKFTSVYWNNLIREKIMIVLLKNNM